MLHKHQLYILTVNVSRLRSGTPSFRKTSLISLLPNGVTQSFLYFNGIKGPLWGLSPPLHHAVFQGQGLWFYFHLPSA